MLFFYRSFLFGWKNTESKNLEKAVSIKIIRNNSQFSISGFFFRSFGYAVHESAENSNRFIFDMQSDI